MNIEKIDLDTFLVKNKLHGLLREIEEKYRAAIEEHNKKQEKKQKVKA
jgi:hypothetical protein